MTIGSFYTSGLCLTAPVALPDGVTVTEMLAVLWDNDPQRDTEAGLWQYPLGANSETRHTTITTSGSTSGWQFFNNAGLSVVVDNESSSYFIVVCTSDFGRQGSVQAVQLFYTN